MPKFFLKVSNAKINNLFNNNNKKKSNFKSFLKKIITKQKKIVKTSLYF